MGCSSISVNHQKTCIFAIPLRKNSGKCPSMADVQLLGSAWFSRSPDYKIVCLMNIKCLHQYRCEVYDSGTRSWKKLEDTFPDMPISDSKFLGIYWNKCVYWTKDTYSILLDLDSGRFRKLPLDVQRMNRHSMERGLKYYFMQSNGYLHWIVHYEDSFLEVFEMDENTSCWFLKYEARLDPVYDVWFLKDEAYYYESEASVELVSCKLEALFSPKVVAMGEMKQQEVLEIVRGEKEEDSALFFYVNGKIICYWFWDGRFELVCDVGRLICEHGRAFQFVESLVPV